MYALCEVKTTNHTILSIRYDRLDEFVEFITRDKVPFLKLVV